MEKDSRSCLVEVHFAIKIGINTILHKMKGLQTLLRPVTTNQSKHLIKKDEYDKEQK